MLILLISYSIVCGYGIKINSDSKEISSSLFLIQVYPKINLRITDNRTIMGKFKNSLVLIVINLAMVIADNPLRGHLQPLGFQRDSDGDVTTLTTLPSNQEFYQLLLKKETALLKNAASSSPAIKKWTEKYLQQEYGNLTLKLEGKTEDQERPIGSLGKGFDTIDNFINTFRQESKYAVTQLPDPMHKDIMVMPFMRCGPLSKSVIESHLWMSSGKTKSKLHRDNSKSN